MERNNDNIAPPPISYVAPPISYVPPIETIKLGNVDPMLDGHIIVQNYPQSYIESMAVDYPHENGEQTQAKVLI